jgi:hypothetical protein
MIIRGAVFVSAAFLLAACNTTTESSFSCRQAYPSSFTGYLTCVESQATVANRQTPEFQYLMGYARVLEDQVRRRQITQQAAYGYFDMKLAEVQQATEQRQAATRADWGRRLRNAGASLGSAYPPPSTSVTCTRITSNTVSCN